MDTNESESHDWLEEFLNVYWLRPENAIWRTLNCHAMQDIDFKEPSLDLSCGDGVFSFLRAGGKFGTDFDIFQGTDYLDNFFDNKDIYNSIPDNYDPKIEKEPEYQITVGTDWKEALLEKADRLNLYKELKQHDNNEPLPFEDDRFRTIFTNSAYWIENIDLHLSEINRILHPEGKAILVLKTPTIHHFLETLEATHGEQLGTEFIDILDRGRRNNKQHLHNREGWTNKLEDAGFDTVDCRTSVTSLHAAMWDVGLRPISPHLIEMAYSLDEQRRVEIKRDWLETWEELLSPFCDTSLALDQQPEAPELIFVVE